VHVSSCVKKLGTAYPRPTTFRDRVLVTVELMIQHRMTTIDADIPRRSAFAACDDELLV